ncbi:NAD(P)H-binding protein [Pseudonocardia sp. CA-142604]|uniref:NAD(P)H-binding protein n=1 Tax=Pseudonocardia sp. CA-142604 TaxID=3240024 RepID=UPI003D8D33E0
MILVTGASGTVGSELLRLLTHRNAQVRAMTRDPARLDAVDALHADVVRADFDDPESLRRAVHGVDCVFLATAPGARIAEHDKAMIDAAMAARVRKIVKLSAIGESTGGDGARPADWHGPGERLLATSGLTWSALRPTSFASNALRWAEAVRADEPVPTPTGPGKQGVIDPRDIAAVAVEALLTDTADGAAHVLTGPELLSAPEMVAQLSEEIGRPLRAVDVPLDVARQQMLAAGFAPAVVDVAVRGYRFVRDGGNAVLTHDVHDILGRPARTFRTWAREHRDAFIGSAADRS